MNNYINANFPKAFGESPEYFINNYTRLIYFIIQDYRYILENKKIHQQEIFQDFFQYIMKNNYQKLRKFDPNRGTKPSVYLVKILRNFIKDKIKLIPNIGEIDIEILKNYINPTIGLEEEYIITESINNALNATYGQATNLEKIIFDKTYNEGLKGLDLAKILGIEVDLIYESNRKVKNIFRKELKKRGIKIKKKERRK